MSKPLPAFFEQFFRWLSEQTEHDGEPSSAAEADAAGPWRVIPLAAGGQALFRLGESPDGGDLPAASFEDLEHAWLAAAVLPGTGRDPLYTLSPEETPAGFAVHHDGRIVGHLRRFNPDVAAAFHVVGCLLRSPAALARLLQAASRLTLAHAAKILAEPARQIAEEPPGE
jgi:hypothetical protein